MTRAAADGWRVRCPPPPPPPSSASTSGEAAPPLSVFPGPASDSLGCELTLLVQQPRERHVALRGRLSTHVLTE